MGYIIKGFSVIVIGMCGFCQKRKELAVEVHFDQGFTVDVCLTCLTEYEKEFPTMAFMKTEYTSS